MQMKKIPVSVYKLDNYGFKVSFFFREKDFLSNKKKILEDLTTLGIDFCALVEYLPERVWMLEEMGYFIHMIFIGRSRESNNIAIHYFTKCLLLDDYVFI